MKRPNNCLLHTGKPTSNDITAVERPHRRSPSRPRSRRDGDGAAGSRTSGPRGHHWEPCTAMEIRHLVASYFSPSSRLRTIARFPRTSR